MKKKRIWLISLLSVGFVIVALGVAVGIIAAKGLGLSYGLYLEAKDDSPMLVVENSPIVMSSRNNRDIFEGLESGDRIFVLHDGVLETYPGRTGAYAVIKLRGGDVSDIPSNVIEDLMSMGWLDGGFEAEYTEPQKEFPILVAYAGWTENGEIYTNALNTEKMSMDGGYYLPIYRLDTLADVEEFRSAFENDLAMEYGFDEIESFNDTIEMYEDEAFLQSHSIMIVYVKANSSTYRYGVESIICDGERFVINVEELKHPHVVTADLAGWYLIVVVRDAMIEDCTDFNAVLVR